MTGSGFGGETFGFGDSGDLIVDGGITGVVGMLVADGVGDGGTTAEAAGTDGFCLSLCFFSPPFFTVTAEPMGSPWIGFAVLPFNEWSGFTVKGIWKRNTAGQISDITLYNVHCTLYNGRGTFSCSHISTCLKACMMTVHPKLSEHKKMILMD